MPLNITPPLLNSSSPWATTIDDLRSLYECQYTGAVSTRTSLLKGGFNHDNAVHQYVFFDASNASPSVTPAASSKSQANGDAYSSAGGVSSLNTLGYSPIPLAQYCSMIKTVISTAQQGATREKPFIISVTGSAEE